MLLDDFYYGQHTGDGQPEPKTHTTFKCLSCLRVLNNVKFMTHVRNHLELGEAVKGDGWEIHTTCRCCHRQLPTCSSCSVTLKVSTLPGSPPRSVKSVNCPSKTGQLLLQHMGDSHKTWRNALRVPRCTYRSSAFADVEAILERGMETRTICFVCFASEFSKLATSFRITPGGTGTRGPFRVPSAGCSF